MFSLSLTGEGIGKNISPDLTQRHATCGHLKDIPHDFVDKNLTFLLKHEIVEKHKGVRLIMIKKILRWHVALNLVLIFPKIQTFTRLKVN